MRASRGMGDINPAKMPKSKLTKRRDDTDFEMFAEGGSVTPAWQRKEGKSESGGLNAAGRASYNRANPGKPGLKAPQPEGGPRKKSFCARSAGQAKMFPKAANDPESRLNKARRKWKC